MERLAALIGLISFLGLAFLMSTNRKRIEKRILIWGLLLQIILAFLVLGIPVLGVPGILHSFFELMNNAIVKILSYSDEGAKFLFGPLVDSEKIGGFIFAFRVLPTIIFFSSLVAILYHLGILQKVVYSLAWIMKKVMPVGGAESLSTAANIFLGQAEAPLMVKPFLEKMSKSELLCIMVGGMANVAGSTLAAYVLILHGRFPDIAGHLLTVSLMSAPATFLIAKMMIPETEKGYPKDEMNMKAEKIDANVIEAATRGGSEGLMIAFSVAAMLIAFIGIVYLFNGILGGVGSLFGLELSLQSLLGYVFSPIAWLLGVPSSEILQAGRLLGEKVVLNEFVAYLSLAEIGNNLSDRTVLISSYALCGFANFSSIGMQIGAIGTMAPSRRSDLARLGIKALIGGNLATFTSACIVSIIT